MNKKKIHTKQLERQHEVEKQEIIKYIVCGNYLMFT